MDGNLENYLIRLLYLNNLYELPFEQATLLASVKTSLAKYLLLFRVHLVVWIEK